MNKEIIKAYIEFALANGYEKWTINTLHSTEWRVHNWESDLYIVMNSSSKNIIEIITSKEFIDSIVRWINIKWLKNINPKYLITTDNLIYFQAHAIYNNTLEDFITNLWIWEQK